MHRSLILGILALVTFVAPPLHAQSLRGSRASVELMYRQAQNHELHFYETGSGVKRAAARGDFVKLSGNDDYRLGSVSYPYVLPTTRTFVQRLAAQYRNACGEKLVVTSGTRPTSLRLSNSAAKSVHPTGMAVDIRKPSKGRCLSWLRGTLQQLDGGGTIEATEEFRPPHFHVAVFPNQYGRYVQGASSGTRLASTSSDEAGESRSARAADAKRTHKVRRGESLWAIARRNGISVDVIKSANDLRGSRIVAGQLLLIPSAR